MKNIFLSVLLALFVMACAPKEAPKDTSAPAQAEAPAASEKGIEMATQTTFEEGKGVLIESGARITATIVAVDRDDRSITLKDPDGNLHDIELTDDVKNFAELHPGDRIVTEIYTGLAMSLAEPGQEYADRTAHQVAVSEPGQPPKIVNVDMAQTLAEISAINRTTREVTVTGPRGKSVTLVVPDHLERFDTIKVGDKVNATYIEAFAIAVEEIN
jgi:hypothetical protein